MYNKPVRFDGDIIITDPCYIMKKGRYNFKEVPCWWDFVSKVIVSERDGMTHYEPPTPSDYEDCVKVPFKEYYKDGGKSYIEKFLKGEIEEEVTENNNLKIAVSLILNAEYNAYHKAADKYHEEHKEDWEICNCGENLEILGFKTYLSDGTIYGDWGCTVFDSHKKKIGEFCADSGMVGVFLLDEVLKYNPDFDYHLNRPWTTTLIKDFHGTVELRKKPIKGYLNEEKVEVVGVGNICFVSIQTGL